MADALAVVYRATGEVEVVVPPRIDDWEGLAGLGRELWWPDLATAPQLGQGDRLEVTWPNGQVTSHYADQPPDVGAGGYSRTPDPW